MEILPQSSDRREQFGNKLNHLNYSIVGICNYVLDWKKIWQERE